MRIDGTHGPESSGLRDARNEPKGPAASARNAPGSSSASSPQAIDPAYRQYVLQTLAGEEADAQAVAEARRSLASGELDSPEAAARLAQILLSRGI